MRENDETRPRPESGPATKINNLTAILPEVCAEVWVVEERAALDRARALRDAWHAALGLRVVDRHQDLEIALATAEVDRVLRAMEAA